MPVKIVKNMESKELVVRIHSAELESAEIDNWIVSI